MPKIAVIWFPGLNCEHETKNVLDACGMDATIVRWNTDKKLSQFDGFVIPGGWSYEDRIRAGVISSKDPLMEKIKEEASKGKPVLGICNGCQVLVESGLVPGFGKVDIAVAPNHNEFVQGYFCTWVNVKNTGNKTAFSSLLAENEVLHMPIAHGEGRFVSNDEELFSKLKEKGQILFSYCDEKGNITEGVNPNGSTLNAAAIANEQGNVVAMMPHPERAFYKKHLPKKEMKDEQDAMAPTAVAKLFESMKEYIQSP